MLPNIFFYMYLPRVVFQDRDVVYFELLWKEKGLVAVLTKIKLFQQFSKLNFSNKFQFIIFSILRRKDEGHTENEFRPHDRRHRNRHWRVSVSPGLRS